MTDIDSVGGPSPTDQDEKCSKCGKDAYPQGGKKPSQVKRVSEEGKPKYQLRQGEAGLSTFDGAISDEKILSNFRPGSKCDTKSVAELEEKGLAVTQTHGDCDHLKDEELQDNHWEIRPGENMTRKQFKKALKTL